MSLATYKPTTESVPLPGGDSLELRGLSFNDIVYLMETNKEALEEVVREFAVDDIDLDSDGIKTMMMKYVRKMPNLSAHVIAIACDEPESVENAKKLPLQTTFESLIIIARLTFEQAGGIKKLFDLVSLALAGVTETMEQGTLITSQVMPKGKKRSTG